MRALSGPMSGPIGDRAIGAVYVPTTLSYLYEQDFEGAGTPSGWTNGGTSGSVDYDYATAPAPLYGTQSMSVYVPSSGYRNTTYASYAAQSDVYVAFAARNEIALLDNTGFFAIRSSANANLGRFRIASGNLTLRDGTDSGIVTLGGFTTGVTAVLMMRYQKGSGTDSVLTAWALSGGAWVQLGQKTNGTGTADASRLIFEANKNAEARLIIDRIRVSSSSIPASVYA